MDPCEPSQRRAHCGRRRGLLRRDDEASSAYGCYRCRLVPRARSGRRGLGEGSFCWAAAGCRAAATRLDDRGALSSWARHSAVAYARHPDGEGRRRLARPERGSIHQTRAPECRGLLRPDPRRRPLVPRPHADDSRGAVAGARPLGGAPNPTCRRVACARRAVLRQRHVDSLGGRRRALRPGAARATPYQSRVRRVRRRVSVAPCGAPLRRPRAGRQRRGGLPFASEPPATGLVQRRRAPLVEQRPR